MEQTALAISPFIQELNLYRFRPKAKIGKTLHAPPIGDSSFYGMDQPAHAATFEPRGDFDVEIV